MAQRALAVAQRAWAVVLGIATAILVFAAVPAALALLADAPFPRRWTVADIVSLHGLFDGLAIVAWCAWAACAWPLLRAVGRRVRAGDTSLRSNARLGDRVAVRIAAAVLAVAPVAITSSVAGALPPPRAVATASGDPAPRPPQLSVLGSLANRALSVREVVPPSLQGTAAPQADSASPGSRATTSANGNATESALSDGTREATVNTQPPSTGQAGLPASSAPTTFTVIAGQSLWSIAQLVYGDGGAWTAIAAANLGRLMPAGARFVDPSLIRPGWVLTIPALDPPSPSPGPATTGTSLVPAAGSVATTGAGLPGAGDASPTNSTPAASAPAISTPPTPAASTPANSPAISTPATTSATAIPAASGTGVPKEGEAPVDRVPLPRTHSDVPPGTAPSSGTGTADGRGTAPRTASHGTSPRHPSPFPLPELPELAALGCGALVSGLLARRARRTRKLVAFLRENGQTPLLPTNREADTLTALEGLDGLVLLEPVELAARHLAATLDSGTSGDVPPVRLLRAGPDGVEVRFSDPVAWVPPDWTSAGASAWKLPATSGPAAGDDVVARYGPWCPILLPVGENAEGAWLVPLESGDCLSILGPSAAELVEAMVAALKSWSWQDQLVVTSEPSDMAIVGRRSDVGPDGGGRAVLFVGDPGALPPGGRSRCATLTTATVPGATLSVLVDQGLASIHPHGVTVRPNLLAADTVEALEAHEAVRAPWAGAGTTRPAVPLTRSPNAVIAPVPLRPPEERVARRAPSSTSGSADMAVRADELGGIGGGGIGGGGIGGGGIGGGGIGGGRAGGGRAGGDERTIGGSSSADPVEGPRPTIRTGAHPAPVTRPGTVEVRLLTAIPRIEGLHEAIDPKRARRAVELVAYLALHHPDPVTGDRLRTRVLGSTDADAAAKTLFNIAGAARRAMGADSSGTPLLPPASRSGHYRISPAVTVDMARAAALVTAGLAAEADDAVILLDQGLSLIEGEPLAGVLTGYGWWRGEGHEQRIADLVVDGACRLSRLATAARALDLARWAIGQARRLEPYSESLSRAAMELAAAGGDRRRLQREWLDCRRLMDELDPGAMPSERTERLYLELRRALGTAGSGTTAPSDLLGATAPEPGADHARRAGV